MAKHSFNPILAIADKMMRYPNVAFQRSINGCEIGAPNDGGFNIELLADGNGWVVYFGKCGPHEHFSDPEDALEFVAFGLSNSCRLREVKMPFLLRAFVEIKNGDYWDCVHEVGYLRLSCSLRSVERIFQNKLIVD